MIKRLLWSMQSGIHELWHKWAKILLHSPSTNEMKRKQDFIDRYKALPKKLTLNLNIVSIFIIYGLGILASTLFLCIELRRFIATSTIFAAMKLWKLFKDFKY